MPQQIENPQLVSVSEPVSPASPSLGERIDFVAGFLRRRYLTILGCLLLSLAVGAGYLYTTRSMYTASATMMIEARKGQLLQQSLLGDAPVDAVWIDSQIGVLKSQSIAAYVVKQLRLAEDPEFASSDAGLLDRLRARLGWGPARDSKSEAERVGEAVAAFMRQLDVRRVGLSYLIRIDFRSHNPEQATKIANAMTDAYAFDQLNAKYQANRRASDWLQERLQSLREQASAAERAVVEFKAKNNIVAAGGRLISDQQLGDLSAQLGANRAKTADLSARLDRIDAILKADQSKTDQSLATVDETISDAMNNGIIQKLRGQYLDLVGREAEWSARYGKTHVAVVNLQKQMRDLRKSMFDELARIRESYRSEYEISKQRHDEVEKRMTGLVSQSQDASQAQISLFSLEAAAQSYRKLYDSFLQRHTEVVQQQSFPVSEARQISAAAVGQTGPKTSTVWLTSIFAGGMLGLGLGALREIMDRGFRTREQVQSVLGTECLALVPLLTDGRANNVLSVFRRQPSHAVQSKSRGNFPVSIADRLIPRRLRTPSKMLRNIVDSPSSPYAEAIRSIRVTLDLKSNAKSSSVFGLTSCLPSEGKSTIAAATALLLAQSGARVILVDCDLRNPSLTRSLAPEAKLGFLDVVVGKANLAEAVWIEPATNMAFLPTVANPLLPNATEILVSDAARSLFVELQIKYDYVIVDLSPLVAAMDIRAASRLISSYVLVIEWGATKVDAVEYALRHAPGVKENIVGAVLNKVDMAVLPHYDSYGANYYYGQSRRAG